VAQAQGDVAVLPQVLPTAIPLLVDVAGGTGCVVAFWDRGGILFCSPHSTVIGDQPWLKLFENSFICLYLYCFLAGRITGNSQAIGRLTGSLTVDSL